MSLRKLWGRSAVSSSKMMDFDSSSSIDEKIPSSSRAQIPTITGKDLTFGTELTVKTLYPDKKGCNNWTETPPKQVKEKVAKAHDRVAIKVYKVVDEERPAIAGRYPLKVQSLEIQSPILLVALKDILANVGHYLETTEVAKFKEPFESLFFSYETILELFDRTGEQDTLKHHLRLLVRVMTDLFGGSKKQLQNLQESKLVTFALAWTYFPKDCVIYCSTEGCDQLYQVKSTAYEKPSSGMLLKVVCKEISFNGTKFDWQTKTLELSAFLGNKPISSLPFYPVAFHTDAKALKRRLTTRGRSIIDYQALTVCEYSGVGVEIGPPVKRHNVSFNIVVQYFNL